MSSFLIENIAIWKLSIIIITSVLSVVYKNAPDPGVGIAVGGASESWSKGSMVRIPAEAAEEFSYPELTFCADSYSVSVSPPCYRSGT